MTIKPSYIVTDMDLEPTYDPQGDGDRIDFSTEKAALKAARERLADTEGHDAEVWVWRLSHVLSKPQVDPVIEAVKPAK